MDVLPDSPGSTNSLADEARNREYRIILSQLRRRGLWMTLPEPLETAFCRQHDERAATAFSSTATTIFVLYASLGIAALVLTGGRGLGYWPVSFGVFLVFILIAWLLSFTTLIHARYQQVVASLAAVAVAVAVVHPHLLGAGGIQHLVHEGTIYVMVIVYLGLNLRFWYAVSAATLAGGTAFLVTWLSGVDMQWQLGIATYGGGSALGMVLRFRDEQRERRIFLHTRLLALDNQRIQVLAGELERLSFLDGLTGVANRRYFDTTLEKHWRACLRDNRPLTLVMLDVDFFKAYNDHYGHQDGDQCLRTIAQTLSRQAARPQDLAARYGGEEFALVFPDADAAAAEQLVSRILAAVRQLELPHAVSEASDVVTLSAGVATIVPTVHATAEDLVKAADQALYDAKNAGRNCWRLRQVRALNA
ncbi:MAG: GGDEF domain-containing protein [Alcanivoracaceae bacterium]|nr:GGDEF domain-containing protein [Alcanivoracaceae bacterium]